MTGKATPLIAFDEAGNTGQDLLNPDQPVFALASLHLTDEETDALLGHLRTQASEVKFQKLRRRQKGRDGLISLLSNDVIHAAKIKSTLTHKSYMATAKMVDLLIEPVLYAHGQDLYERGSNIATANLLHTCYPTFLGPEPYRRLQLLFVRMMRSREESDWIAFYQFCEDIFREHQHEEWSHLLGLMWFSSHVDDPTDTNSLHLDPAIPSFFQHCAAWGEELGHDFDLVHDDSKPIAQSEALFRALMPKDEPVEVVGADRRKTVLPLRATGIQFDSSHNVKQLQVADLVASSLAYVGVHRATGQGDSGFVDALLQTNLLKTLIDVMWPSTDVTPEDLGTDEASEEPMMDKLADVIERYRRKRGGSS